jgi:hypothetical protein
MRPARALVPVLLVLLTPVTVAAQEPLSEVLSFLLTTRSVQTDDFARDAQAAATTRDTITTLLGAEIAAQPPSLSSVGFAYRFDGELSTLVRSSRNFGSFLTERSLTAGRGQAALGMNLRLTHYTSLDGRDLEDGTFVTTANQFRDERAPFDQETLTLQLDSRVLTFTGTYGVTDRLDLSAAVPFVSLSLDGSRVNTYRGHATVQATAEATANGIGDVAVRAKYGLVSGRTRGLAIAGEVRLPTGREEALLGAGKTAFSALLIGSGERGPLGWAGNVSLGGGGLSNEVAYRGSVCYAVSERVTVVGELIGRRLGDVGRISEARAPHPTIPGVDTIRLVAEDTTLSTSSMVAGAKWNVAGTWILGGHAMVPMSDSGLRSGVVVLGGLDYTFGQ